MLPMARTAQMSETERRLSLLKAAFREVSEKGFSEVTLDDIARRAGVSKGLPWNCYSVCIRASPDLAVDKLAIEIGEDRALERT